MWFLSIRQLISRPQQTLLTFIGITLGTATYIIFSGMMLGFQDYLIDKLINDSPHIIISPRDEPVTAETFKGVFFAGTSIKWLEPPSGKTNNAYLSNVAGWIERFNSDARVVAYSPRLNQQIIVKKGKVSQAVKLVGIVPAQEARVTTIEKNVISGSYKAMGEGESLVLLGEGLFKKLGSKLGGTVHAVSSSGELSPLKVKGVVRTGIVSLDETLAYTSLRTAQNITNSSSQINSIGVKLNQITQAAEIAANWSQFSRDKIESWAEANESILSVFNTQDIMRNSITAIIIVVIAFGIYNILTMVVSQKKKEIAILRSIGYDAKDIIELFLIQGSLLGIIGGLAGLVAGAVALYFIGQIEVSRSFGSNKMLISWKYIIYVKGFLITVAATVVASVLPARKGAKLSPIDIIRGIV